MSTGMYVLFAAITFASFCGAMSVATKTHVRRYEVIFILCILICSTSGAWLFGNLLVLFTGNPEHREHRKVSFIVLEKRIEDHHDRTGHIGTPMLLDQDRHKHYVEESLFNRAHEGQPITFEK